MQWGRMELPVVFLVIALKIKTGEKFTVLDNGQLVIANSKGEIIHKEKGTWIEIEG